MVNGKRTAAHSLIRAAFAPDLSSVTLSVSGDQRKIPAPRYLPSETRQPLNLVF